MRTDRSLDSKFTVKFCVLAASALYIDLRKQKGHVRSELSKHCTDQCATLRALSLAKVSRDWYDTRTVLYCY